MLMGLNDMKLPAMPPIPEPPRQAEWRRRREIAVEVTQDLIDALWLVTRTGEFDPDTLTFRDTGMTLVYSAEDPTRRIEIQFSDD